MRSYAYIDLLVRQRDIRRATELLSADGFTPAVPLTAIDAGDLPGIDCGERNSGRETVSAQQFRGAADVALANEEINVCIATHRRIALGEHRQDPHFYD